MHNEADHKILYLEAYDTDEQRLQDTVYARLALTPAAVARINSLFTIVHRHNLDECRVTCAVSWNGADIDASSSQLVVTADQLWLTNGRSETRPLSDAEFDVMRRGEASHIFHCDPSIEDFDEWVAEHEDLGPEGLEA